MFSAVCCTGPDPPIQRAGVFLLICSVKHPLSYWNLLSPQPWICSLSMRRNMWLRWLDITSHVSFKLCSFLFVLRIFCRMQQQTLHTLSVAAIGPLHVSEVAVNRLSIFTENLSTPFIPLLMFFCGSAQSTERYCCLTCQTSRRNYSAQSFNLFVLLSPEIPWF